jgi:hypothetical protein
MTALPTTHPSPVWRVGGGRLIDNQQRDTRRGSRGRSIRSMFKRMKRSHEVFLGITSSLTRLCETAERWRHETAPSHPRGTVKP